MDLKEFRLSSLTALQDEGLSELPATDGARLKRSLRLRIAVRNNFRCAPLSCHAWWCLPKLFFQELQRRAEKSLLAPFFALLSMRRWFEHNFSIHAHPFRLAVATCVLLLYFF